jgi:transposase
MASTPRSRGSKPRFHQRRQDAEIAARSTKPTPRGHAARSRASSVPLCCGGELHVIGETVSEMLDRVCAASADTNRPCGILIASVWLVSRSRLLDHIELDAGKPAMLAAMSRANKIAETWSSPQQIAPVEWPPQVDGTNHAATAYLHCHETIWQNENATI